MHEKLTFHKVYWLGEFVATAHAMTKGEAVTQVANRFKEYGESGLMAVRSA